MLVDAAAYTRDLANHDFLDDIPVGARIATSGNLSSKTSTDGVLDAADVTFSSVTGASCEYIVVYKDTGTASTSPLICCLDTGEGLHVTPDGSDITIAWDSNPNRIGKL